MDKAVAVKYDSTLPAPFVAAAGKGALARRIMAIARERGVRLVAEPIVADALVELEVGSRIPQEFYGIIAELLVFVRNVDSRR